MRLLITGGAGFIGANLCRRATALGHDLTVLDDLSTGATEGLQGLDLRFVKGSILDAKALATALDGAEAVIHLAALPSVPRSISAPLASHAANATGTLHLLEAARMRHGIHVISASSSSVYGANPALWKSEREWVRPLSPYAVSKLAAEQYTLAYQQSFGMDTLAFRFFNVYGPGQPAGHAYAAVVPAFIQAILTGHSVPVHGDGLQSRDFTYVGTVCDVLLDAALHRISHCEPVNLAFGTNTTLLQLLDVLREALGIDFEIDSLPPRSGDVRHSRAHSGVLKALFPDVSPVPLTQGIKETVAWARACM